MGNRVNLHHLADFGEFFSEVNITQVIAAADEHGNVQGYEKEIYALAIIRAVSKGDFGTNPKVKIAAISALWERGYRTGFSMESFNAVFEDYFCGW